MSDNNGSSLIAGAFGALVIYGAVEFIIVVSAFVAIGYIIAIIALISAAVAFLAFLSRDLRRIRDQLLIPTTFAAAMFVGAFISLQNPTWTTSLWHTMNHGGGGAALGAGLVILCLGIFGELLPFAVLGLMVAPAQDLRNVGYGLAVITGLACGFTNLAATLCHCT